MNVFCVLFFVLINTIGNKGNLNTYRPWPNTIPPYITMINKIFEKEGKAIEGDVQEHYAGQLMNLRITQGDRNWHNWVPDMWEDVYRVVVEVSLRNWSNGHMCTGSVISKDWVLSSINCKEAIFFVYGLREFMNNQKSKGEHSTGAWKKRLSEHSTLIKLHKPVGRMFKKLHIPTLSESGPPETGEVIGWVFDSEKNLVVMKTISANITEAFSGTNEEFCELGRGSPLIASGIIYGFLEDCQQPFVKVEDELEWIENIMKNN